MQDDDVPDTPGEWVIEAAEQIPEELRDDPPAIVVDNKIARVKWPDEIEGGEISQDAVDRVTDQQRQVVLDELTDETSSSADVSDEPAEQESDEETVARDRLDELGSGVPANAQPATDGGSETADGDSTRRPMTDGGTASMLESRSLGPDPCCPCCGGRLRETEQDLVAECTRAQCRRRVSLTDVADALADGPGGTLDPGD